MTARDLPPLPYEFREVRQRLQRDLDLVLSKLQLRGQSDGTRIFPLNPRRNDRKPGSFVIWLDGDRRGGWRDYATGDAGDVLDLIAYVEGLERRIDAYWRALDMLGLARNANLRTKAQAQLDRERLAADRAAADARAQAQTEARAAQCFKTWLGLAPIAGTPAETYLRDARGLPLERLKELPGALRWAPSVDWIDPETGEVITWPHCMVSAMTRGSKITALHRTFLKPDGSGKREDGKAKTMIGSVKGAAIRLTKGESGLSPGAAAKAGRRDPLVIGEGIETCLSVAIARPGLRVWAAGSLSLMGLLDWPECASAVVLLRDNDWHSAEAQRAFARVEAHWRDRGAGRPVHVAAPPKEINDYNDWARTAA